MAATTFNFRQGDSYAIGIRLDADYNVLGLQEIKVSLFGDTFTPASTTDPRVFRISISSSKSATLSSGYYPLELFLDDVNFGIKKTVLAIAYVTPSISESNASINTGYDLILDVKIISTPIEIVATVVTLVKGDKGDQGIQGIDGGASDGNKGDITVSGNGTNWAVNDAVKGRKKLNFSYGDVTTQIIYQAIAGQRVTNIKLGFDVAFNVASALSVGDGTNTQRLMDTGQNYPLRGGIYGTTPFYKYAANTNILLTVNAGVGCTQGSGTVIIYYE